MTSTRPGRTFIFEVDGSQEGDGYELDIIRVGPAYLEKDPVWLVHR